MTDTVTLSIITHSMMTFCSMTIRTVTIRTMAIRTMTISTMTYGTTTVSISKKTAWVSQFTMLSAVRLNVFTLSVILLDVLAP
jgi:hypothetical protein